VTSTRPSAALLLIGRLLRAAPVSASAVPSTVADRPICARRPPAAKALASTRSINTLTSKKDLGAVVASSHSKPAASAMLRMPNKRPITIATR
jgi:hypothetical protein